MRWLLAAVAFSGGWLSAQPVPTAEVHRGHYVVKMEDFTSASGIRFFALQRMDSQTIDQAVLSIDDDLPLARDLMAVDGVQIELVVRRMEPRTLQSLKR